jgi:ATP-dependent RNA circularization protein (DNA/RNA ligase family)
MTEAERNYFLNREIHVEEKVDGANLGISFDCNGDIRAQNRGDYLTPPFLGQWERLKGWLDSREDALFECLSDEFILFGEWCYAKHSIFYDALPDLFLGFDIFDKKKRVFFCVPQRDDFFRLLNIASVPQIAHGRFSLGNLKNMLSQSKLGNARAEGLYLRADEDDRLLQRAKLVRESFVQSQEEHWSRSGVMRNGILAR